MHYLNLKGYRCPTVMIKIRKAVDTLMLSSNELDIIIDTIEPSAERDIRAFLAKIYPSLKCQIIFLPLTPELISSWGDDFDAEDIAGIDHVCRFGISLG